MPTVLHIDGHSAGGSSFETDFINPGETAADVLNRLAVKWRLEHIPDPPPVLSQEAEQFIHTYKREDPDSVLAIYWRYHSLEAEEFDTAEEAKRFIKSGREQALREEGVIRSLVGHSYFGPAGCGSRTSSSIS